MYKVINNEMRKKTKGSTKVFSGSVVLLGALLASGCGSDSNDNPLSVTPESNAALSASFVQNGLPNQANDICDDAEDQGGIPVVFDQEIDQETLDVDDFAVRLESGELRTPQCAERNPAGDEKEDRTILLVGDFGDGEIDPPVSVEVVAELLDETGNNLIGTTISVTGLSEGPNLVFAEPATLEETSCPETAMSAVRLTWNGGISALNGEELGANQLGQFSVTTVDGVVNPVEFSDLDDNDNNLELCLTTEAEASSVSVALNTVQDLGGDPNADTEIDVTQEDSIESQVDEEVDSAEDSLEGAGDEIEEEANSAEDSLEGAGDEVEEEANSAEDSVDGAQANVEAAADDAEDTGNEVEADLEAEANSAEDSVDGAQANVEAAADDAEDTGNEVEADLEAEANSAEDSVDNAQAEIDAEANDAEDSSTDANTAAAANDANQTSTANTPNNPNLELSEDPANSTNSINRPEPISRVEPVNNANTINRVNNPTSINRTNTSTANQNI